MRCEIIDGKLHVYAGSLTEQWALNQFIGNMYSYMSPQSYIVDADEMRAKEATKPPTEHDTELDAIFGPKS